MIVIFVNNGNYALTKYLIHDTKIFLSCDRWVCFGQPNIFKIYRNRIVIQHFPVLWGTYLAGKMPALQEFHDSTLYLIRAETAVVFEF